MVFASSDSFGRAFMKLHIVLASCLLLSLTFLRTAVALDAFPVVGDGFGPSTPAVAELNNNAADGLETALVSLNGKVQVIKADGSLVWAADLPNVTCSNTPTTDKAHSSPVIGALFGDGIQYIVVGYGGFVGKPCDGGVVAYRASDGARKWVFSIKRWARLKKFFAFRHAVYGTPALGDVDGDGKLEIGFGSFDRNIYLLNSNGKVRWYAIAADTVFSTPSFVDINGDGKREMIISTDISKNTRLNPPTPNGGYVYALKASIKVPAGTQFGFRDARLQVWRHQFDQVMQASPIVGEVLPSNPGLEVVVGSGCFFSQGGGDRRGKWFKVLSARTGKVLKTLPVSSCTPSAPGLIDIDADGVLDVVGTTSGISGAGGDGLSHVVAWSPSRDVVLWDSTPYSGGRRDRYGGYYNRTPIGADITGDGVPEVLVNYSTDVVILNTAGAMLTCGERPCSLPLMRTGSLMKGRPMVADTDLDGRPEVIVGGEYDNRSCMIRWEDPLAN